MEPARKGVVGVEIVKPDQPVRMLLHLVFRHDESCITFGQPGAPASAQPAAPESE